MSNFPAKILFLIIINYVRGLFNHLHGLAIFTHLHIALEVLSSNSRGTNKCFGKVGDSKLMMYLPVKEMINEKDIEMCQPHAQHRGMRFHG